MSNDTFSAELFDGLKALAESAFPKKCNTCGKEFNSAEEFLLETEAINEKKTGLKQSIDDDGSNIVEAYRNCPCGSTLMDFFSDRRDLSDNGLKRREKFGELLDTLIEAGLDGEIARTELKKVMRGTKSEILAKFQRKKAAE